jgi:hypothetical protein
MNFTACSAGLSGVLTPKKIRKKACQGFGPSAREECRATNALILSFKKKSKK